MAQSFSMTFKVVCNDKKMKHPGNFRLAVDEKGSPFVLNSKGSIDFGYITEEMNLPPAPIRIAEGDDNYGLTHIELRHGTQLRDNGFSCAHEFVELVIHSFWKYIMNTMIHCSLNW